MAESRRKNHIVTLNALSAEFEQLYASWIREIDFREYKDADKTYVKFKTCQDPEEQVSLLNQLLEELAKNFKKLPNKTAVNVTVELQTFLQKYINHIKIGNDVKTYEGWKNVMKRKTIREKMKPDSSNTKKLDKLYEAYSTTQKDELLIPLMAAIHQWINDKEDEIIKKVSEKDKNKNINPDDLKNAFETNSRYLAVSALKEYFDSKHDNEQTKKNAILKQQEAALKKHEAGMVHHDNIEKEIKGSVFSNFASLNSLFKPENPLGEKPEPKEATDEKKHKP